MPAEATGCCETALVNDAQVVEFDHLANADLVVDRVYRGGSVGGTRDDPLSKLLPVGNQGGFRPVGSATKNTVKLAVLPNPTGRMRWTPIQVPSPTTVTTGNQARRWMAPRETGC